MPKLSRGSRTLSMALSSTSNGSYHYSIDLEVESLMLSGK